MSDPLRAPHLIVAGRARDSARRPVRSPFDDRDVGSVPEAAARDIEDAIAAAHAAAVRERCAPTPFHTRVAVLERAREAIRSSTESLARLISDEAGKPITYARVEAARAVDTFAAAIDVARASRGEVVEVSAYAASEDRVAIVRRVPVGAVTAITPFNFPLNLVAHKLAPAVAAGCPMVLKPSPQAPLSAFALATILLEAGLPPDHISVVPCSNDLAARLVEDARIAMLTFTGSAAVGWGLRAKCGEKRCTLELGGNAAVIVHHDSDLERAAGRIVAGSFGYAGQSCIAVQRIFAHRSIYDELRARLLAETEKIGVGDPARDDVVSGPVIDDHAVDRIEAVVSEAVAAGARSNARFERDRRVFRPVFLEGVPANARARVDELFAPAALLDPYDDFESALDLADAGRWGLQSGVYTRDLERVMRAWERLEVGAVIHDDVPTFRADAMPYGGVRSSGVGREGPSYAYAEMTEPRVLLIRHPRGHRSGG